MCSEKKIYYSIPLSHCQIKSDRKRELLYGRRVKVFCSYVLDI